MYKPEHKTTDLENAAFFSVPGFPYSRQSFQGFMLFSTCLTLYGELKYLCAIKFFFAPKSRNLAAMHLLCNGPAVHVHTVETQIVANRS